MARSSRICRTLARAVLGIVVLCGSAACSSEGKTANCRTASGEELPLYDINEVDSDSGRHPDDEIEDIRSELVDRRCLTAIGHATTPDLDAGTD